MASMPQVVIALTARVESAPETSEDKKLFRCRSVCLVISTPAEITQIDILKP